MNKRYPLVSAILFFALSHLAAIGQDLIVTDVSGSKTVTQYATLAVSVTVKNQGIVPITKTFLTNAYLSTDNVQSSGDTYLSGKTVSSLAENGQTVITLSGTVSLNPGTYYLIVTTDASQQVTETDETNNQTVVASYEVTAASVDFSIASLTYARTALAPYDCAQATYMIQNSGTTPVTAVYTSFYLSANDVLDAGDQLLGHSLYSTVGTTSDFRNNLPIPLVANGGYYIIARTDDFQETPQYNESDETNNIQVTPITITSSNIDLDVVTPSFGAGTTAYFTDGLRQLMVNFELLNNGTTGVIGYDVAVYLSTDGIYNEWVDRLVTTTTLDHSSYYVAPAQTLRNSVTVPIDHESGAFYVILKFNPTGTIPETNTSNNTVITISSVIIPPPASIELSGGLVNGTPNDHDNSISLTMEYFNPSTLSRFSDIVSYTTQIFNSAGFSLSYDFFTNYVSLSENTTQQQPYTLSLSNPLPAGNYTIRFDCFNGEGCTNNSFTMPLVIEPSTFSLNGSIQTASEGTPLSSGKLFLYQKDNGGTVKFTQKVDPLTISDFDFPVDGQPYTLYFIPNPVAYPRAIPTILGKTIALNNNSFVSLTADYTTLLEVLEITPLTETGNRVISGNVHTASSNVSAGRDDAGEPVPVVLLSDTGIPVAITYADENGNYEFTNLPDGNYNLQLSREPDRPQMPTAVAIDATEHSVEVNFDLTGATPQTQTRLKQIITFNTLAARTYGDAAFELDAQADSGLPMSYESSDESVARIDGNRVTIIGAGSALITASQEGNAGYALAIATQKLNVDKADQSITFAALPEIPSTDGSLELVATSSSSLEVTYVSADESIASIDGRIVTIHNSGTVLITAHQQGDKNYHAATSVSRELTINLVTGIAETQAVVEAYPNPTRDLVRIPYNVSEVNVVDALGRTERVTLQDQYLDLSQRQPGLYLVKVMIGNTGRILKISKE